MIAVNEKGMDAYIAACRYFETTTMPIGRGVIAGLHRETVLRDCVQRKKYRVQSQVFTVIVPSLDSFLSTIKPMRDQPYPVLHRIMSKEALSILYHDDLAVFLWQLASYCKEQPEDKRNTITIDETNSFFHEKRKALLVLPSGDDYIKMLVASSKTRDAAIVASYLSYFGIAGIQYEEESEARLLIFDPRKNITITAINRGYCIDSLNKTIGARHE
jgi:hypothetical protein